MKFDWGRWLIAGALFGLIGVGILLLTNHWGIAIKITNYMFFVLLLGVVYEIIFFKK